MQVATEWIESVKIVLNFIDKQDSTLGSGFLRRL